MTFVHHPWFEEPDPEAVVWRYMDFTKFVALLDTRSLWFSNPAYLGDPWEMATTDNHVEVLRRQGMLDTQAQREGARQASLQLRNVIFVNCWHLGTGESAAMWRLYLNSTEGVSIQSTWAQLTDSLGTRANGESFYAVGGRIRYIDYARDVTPDANLYLRTSNKRESFSYEQEARLVIWYRWPEVPEFGFDVPWDVSNGINKVVLAPGSAPWFKQLVRSVARKYEFDSPIEDSSMDAEPNFYY